MKKTLRNSILAVLMICMLITFAACNGDGEQESDATDAVTTADVDEQTTDTESETETETETEAQPGQDDNWTNFY